MNSNFHDSNQRIQLELGIISILTDDQAVGVDGAADAVHADVGVVGEAVLACYPAQRRMDLPTGLGHSDEFCKEDVTSKLNP